MKSHIIPAILLGLLVVGYSGFQADFNSCKANTAGFSVHSKTGLLSSPHQDQLNKGKQGSLSIIFQRASTADIWHSPSFAGIENVNSEEKRIFSAFSHRSDQQGERVFSFAQKAAVNYYSPFDKELALTFLSTVILLH